MKNNSKVSYQLEEDLEIYIQKSQQESFTQQEAIELNKKLLSYISSLNFKAQIEKGQQYLKKINEAISQTLKNQTTEFKNRTDYYGNIKLFVNQFNSCNSSAKKLNAVIYHITKLIEQEDSEEANQITNLKVYEKQFAKIYMKIMEIYLFQAIAFMIMNENQIEEQQYLLLEISEIINQLDAADTDLVIFERYKKYLIDVYEQRYFRIYDEWAYQYNTIQFIKKIKRELEHIDKLNIILNKKSDIYQNLTMNLYKIIDKYILRKHDKYLYNAQQQYSLQNLLENYYLSKGQSKTALQDFYFVCKKVNTNFTQFKTILYDHIKSKGQQILDQQSINQSNEIIQKISQLYYFYKQMNEVCFSKSSDLIMQINKALEDLCSNQAYPKLLIETINNKILDQCIKKQQSYDMDTIYELNKVLELCLFLKNQEEFVKLYYQSLYNRIFTFSRISHLKLNTFLINEVLTVKVLYTLSGNEEWKYIINILMRIQQYYREDPIKKLNSIQISPILSIPENSYFQKVKYMQLPQIDQLKQLYLKRQKTQNQHQYQYSLQWLDDISSVEIYEKQQNLILNVTVRQAVILYQFNIDEGPISLTKLSQQLQENLNSFKHDLIALQKAKILLKSKTNGEIFYSYNCNQKENNSQRKKIFTKLIRQQKCLEQNQDDQKENQKEKILARISRIMKKQKKMLYSELLEQINQSYQIIQQEFKQLIDKLLDQDILSRCTDDINLLKYQPN